MASKSKQIFIILSFIGLSFLFIIYCRYGVVFNGDDMPYHINRIIEATTNLKDGHIYTVLMTHTFKKIAYPLGIFYPSVTIFPFALFGVLISNPVHAIYAGFFFYTFLTLCTTYISFKKIINRRIGPYVGAIAYTFSSYHTINAYTRFALGEYLAMTFLPLAVYGFYAILFKDKKEWYYLAIGMIFIVTSHVLTTFIITLFFAILIFILLPWIKEKWVALRYIVLAGVVTLLGSSIFIYSFVQQELYQSFEQPSVWNLYNSSANASDIVLALLNNSFKSAFDGNTYNLGITLFIVTIVGIFRYKVLSNIGKIAVMVSLVTLLMTTKLFPWFIFQKTIFSVIQTPSRLLILTTLFSSYILCELVQSYYMDAKNNVVKSYIIIAVLIGILAPWSAGMHQILSSNTMTNWTKYTGTVKNYDNIEWALYLDQYTPRDGQKTLKEVSNNIAIIGRKKYKVTQIKSGYNKLVFEDNKIVNAKKVDIPVYRYLNYQIFNSKGQKLSVSKSKRGTILVNKRSGDKIVVRYVPSKGEIFTRVISIITWIILLLYAFIREGYRSKEQERLFNE